jgi:hypothetical protein
MFKYKDLDELVFDNSIDADEFIIITGYIGPPVIEELRKLPYKATIYVGMYGNNISTTLHNSLLKNNEEGKIDIKYTKQLIHAKCYLWLKNGKLKKTLIGSANFSTSGLYTPKKEVLGDLSKKDLSRTKKYLRLIEANSYSILEHVVNEPLVNIEQTEETIQGTEIASLSLLAKKGVATRNIIGKTTKMGEVHCGSGLNWGFSNALPKPNDAYIKITAEDVRKHLFLFPQKPSGVNLPIDVIWDDGTEMQMLLEGNQEIEGCLYPKQISTYKNKSEIGIYLRKRIGDRIGIDLSIPKNLSKQDFKAKASQYKDKLITKEMLEKYGRTSIEVKLIGDKTYYFDFSPIEKE